MAHHTVIMLKFDSDNNMVKSILKINRIQHGTDKSQI